MQAALYRIISRENVSVAALANARVLKAQYWNALRAFGGFWHASPFENVISPDAPSNADHELDFSDQKHRARERFAGSCTARKRAGPMRIRVLRRSVGAISLSPRPGRASTDEPRTRRLIPCAGQGSYGPDVRTIAADGAWREVQTIFCSNLARILRSWSGNSTPARSC